MGRRESPEIARFWWLQRLSLAGGAVLLLCSLLWLAWDHESRRRLDQALDRARAAGIALSSADIRFEPVRPDDNAATYLRAALSAFVADDTLPQPGHFRADPRGMLQFEPLFRWHLADNADALCLLRAARSRPACAWDQELFHPESRPRYYPSWQSLVELAMTRATFSLADGDPLDAVESIRDMAACGRLFAAVGQPFNLTNTLVWNEMTLAQTIEALLPDLFDTGYTPQTAVPLRAALELLLADLLDEQPFLDHAAAGIRTIPRDTLLHVENHLFPSPTSGSGRFPDVRLSVPGRPRRSLSELPRPPFDVILTPAIRLDIAREFDVAEAAASKGWDFEPEVQYGEIANLPWPGSLVTRAARPLFERQEELLYAHVRSGVRVALAKRRMAAIGVGLRLYVLDHGSLPRQLKALTPRYLPTIPPNPLSPQEEDFVYSPDPPAPGLWATRNLDASVVAIMQGGWLPRQTFNLGKAAEDPEFHLFGPPHRDFEHVRLEFNLSQALDRSRQQEGQANEEEQPDGDEQPPE